MRASRREGVRGDDLDAERLQHERQDERRGGVAVVDDDPEPALADRLDVEAREEIGRVAVGGARGIRDRADVGRADAARLVAREVLLDLLLQRGGELDARALVELDRDDLRVRRVDADVHARVEVLGLEQVPVDRRRQHAQVGDVDAGRRGCP